MQRLLEIEFGILDSIVAEGGSRQPKQDGNEANYSALINFKTNSWFVMNLISPFGEIVIR